MWAEGEVHGRARWTATEDSVLPFSRVSVMSSCLLTCPQAGTEVDPTAASESRRSRAWSWGAAGPQVTMPREGRAGAPQGPGEAAQGAGTKRRSEPVPVVSLRRRLPGCLAM